MRILAKIFHFVLHEVETLEIKVHAPLLVPSQDGNLLQLLVSINHLLANDDSNVRVISAFAHAEDQNGLAGVGLIELQVDCVLDDVALVVNEENHTVVADDYVSVPEVDGLSILHVRVLDGYFKIVLELLLPDDEALLVLLEGDDGLTIIRSYDVATLHEVQDDILLLWRVVIIIIDLEAVNVVEISYEKHLTGQRVVEHALLADCVQ